MTSPYPLVVVGTDGSATASRAVQRAGSLAGALGIPVLIATAYWRTRSVDAGPPSEQAAMPTDAWISAGYRGAAETAQDAAVIAKRAGATQVDTTAVEGEPATALLDLARSRRGALLVVGGQGLSASPVLRLGNVPNKIIHHPPGDILVVQTSQERAPEAPRRMLIGTDGSTTAARAVDRGLQLGAALDADVTLLTVGKPQWAAEVLAEAEQVARRHGARATTLALPGDPAAVIVEQAAAHDLVVVGNKGMTGALRFLLGSVPEKVSHHVPADLLIVKTT